MKKQRSRVITLENKPSVIASASVTGKTEAEGPLGCEFDFSYPDDGIGCASWESAESALINNAVSLVIEKAGLYKDEIDMILAGDLLNQCTASTYGVRSMDIPFAGLFGACSTMAYSLALAAILVDGGYLRNAVAATSSHFCAAEKQFRYPLEYGAQRSPSSQRTVTGSGAFAVGKNNKAKIFIPRVMFGKITDKGISDTSNMGAAMAPAAAKSIAEYLSDTNTVPSDYDMILTGDLGQVGSDILLDYILSEYGIDISRVHHDCGVMIFDRNSQDVHSGGSGCGCSAVVTASVVMRKMSQGELKKVLFAGTGALMSPLISLQGESLPAIAHIVEFNTEVK